MSVVSKSNYKYQLSGKFPGICQLAVNFFAICQLSVNPIQTLVPVNEHKELWSLSLIGSAFDTVAGTCCINRTRSFMASLRRFVPATYPMKFNELNFCARCDGDKMSPKLLLQQIPGTFSCACKCCDFVPATRRCSMSPQFALHKFFVAAA